MAKRLFIAATGQHSGKTTTSLALLHLARRHYDRVGFIKPFGAKLVSEKGLWVDKDAALMAAVFGLHRYLPWMSPVVVHPDTTRRVVDGDISVAELQSRVVDCFAELEKHCDFIIIEGSGHPGVGSVMQLSNPGVAALLKAPVLLVSGGGLGKVVDDVTLCLALFRQEQVPVPAILVNKIRSEKRTTMLDYLRRALAGQPLTVFGGLDLEPMLGHPTFCGLSSLLNLPLLGNRRSAGRIIHNIQVAAGPAKRLAELIREGTLLIISSSRDDLLLTLCHLYQLPEYHSLIVGMVISGRQPLNGVTRRIIESCRIPYLRAQRRTTAELLRVINDDVAKITPRDKEKLDLVTTLADRMLDFQEIERVCIGSRSGSQLTTRPKQKREVAAGRGRPLGLTSR